MRMLDKAKIAYEAIEYEVDENTAVLAVDSFVAELNKLGCLE